MAFDVSKAMEGEDPDRVVSPADLERAWEPLRRSLEQATRGFGGVGNFESFFEQQRRQNRELVRNLSGMGPTKRLAEQIVKGVASSGFTQTSREASKRALRNLTQTNIGGFDPGQIKVSVPKYEPPKLRSIPPPSVPAHRHQPSKVVVTVPKPETDLLKHPLFTAVVGAVVGAALSNPGWVWDRMAWVLAELGELLLKLLG